MLKNSVSYQNIMLTFESVGTKLRKLIIAGDSAGGNLVFAVTSRVCSDLIMYNNQQAIYENFRAPDALIMSYPAAYLAESPSPARMVGLVAPLVNFAFLQMCSKSYVPKSFRAK